MTKTAAVKRNTPWDYCKLRLAIRADLASQPDAERLWAIRAGPVVMHTDADAMYEMDGVLYTYDELCAAIEAEAATLPPETWRSGEWNLNDYMIEAEQVGIITRLHRDDDVDDDHV